MFKFTFDKLIRDKLIERMNNEGVIVRQKERLNFPDFTKALHKKLLEEAQEVIEAETQEELVVELADLLEVIYVIAENNNIQKEEIETERLKKREINGQFTPEAYIEHIEVADDNQKVINYFKNKKKSYVLI